MTALLTLLIFGGGLLLFLAAATALYDGSHRLRRGLDVLLPPVGEPISHVRPQPPGVRYDDCYVGDDGDAA